MDSDNFNPLWIVQDGENKIRKHAQHVEMVENHIIAILRDGLCKRVTSFRVSYSQFGVVHKFYFPISDNLPGFDAKTF